MRLVCRPAPSPLMEGRREKTGSEGSETDAVTGKAMPPSTPCTADASPPAVSSPGSPLLELPERQPDPRAREKAQTVRERLKSLVPSAGEGQPAPAVPSEESEDPNRLARLGELIAKRAPEEGGSSEDLWGLVEAGTNQYGGKTYRRDDGKGQLLEVQLDASENLRERKELGSHPDGSQLSRTEKYDAPKPGEKEGRLQEYLLTTRGADGSTTTEQRKFDDEGGWKQTVESKDSTGRTTERRTENYDKNGNRI